MDLGFVLLIFSYSLFIDRFGAVSAGPKTFEIIENRKKVEELAVEHANYKHSWKNKISKPIRKLKKNICDREPNIKVEFCYRFLPMAYMGFEFESRRDDDLICVENTFRILPPHDYETDSFKLEMYPCPNIKYRDVETDKDVTITRRYYVSEGIKHNSAIVFFQENKDDENGQIYPKKYVNNIVFKELKTSRPDYEYRPIVEPHEDADVEVTRYGEAKLTLRKPYDKFQRFFHSMNVCGLPKSHKVHLCRGKVRIFFKSPDAELNLQVYDQYRCKRRRLKPPTTEDVYYMKTGAFQHEEIIVSLLLCPPMLEMHDQKTIKPFLYLSSTLRPSSVSFLTRTNHWGDTFKWRSVFFDMSTLPLVQDRRRVRRMTYPSEIERREHLEALRRSELKEFETKVHWTVTNVQTPVIMAKSGLVRWRARRGILTPAPIIRKEPLVEDILISFSEVKAMKSAYGRFMKTFRSLDICELPSKLLDALCENILKLTPFEYYPTTFEEEEQSNESFHSVDSEFSDRNTNRGCSRRTVNLAIREIDSLKAKYFSMRQCPKAQRTAGHYTTTYYIAKYHLKNALLLFKTHYAGLDENMILPDAVATKIDREGLAQIVFHDMAAH